MKHFYFIITLLLTTSITLAQVPANYYDTANGLTEYTLKSQLKQIIDDNTDGLSPEYTSIDPGYGALYNTYLTSDVDLYYENNGSVLDMYTENPTGMDIHEFFYNSDPSQQDMGTGGTAEGQFYNREHIIPQSTFSSATPMRSDAHFVVPSDKYVNGQRGNLPFGDVASATNTYSNGTKKGSSAVTGYSGNVFEPIDEFKGDIARMHFYFATRYESTVAGYSYDMFNNTSNQVFTNAFLDLLLTWHNNDPVSTREIDRNNAIFAEQNNRNPFIDHPEYVNAIWNPMPDTEAPTDPTNLVASDFLSNNGIFLDWDASTDNVGVVGYDIYQDGVQLYTSTISEYNVTGLLDNTNYCFTVLAKDAAGNMSNLSNQACDTYINTNTGGYGLNELFISEYMEGSSTNKALEIANFTGASVSLSDYTMKLASNGNSFGSAVTFPAGATIAHEDVYVIVNSGLNLGCESEGDYINNTITGFNGNDAIGLFKNDILIDIVGTEGSSATFAENTTLVRDESMVPSITFNLNDWITLSSDTCDNLGQHSQVSLSIPEVNKEKFKIYPNPVRGTLLTIEVTQNTQFKIYDILGKKILKGNVTPTNNKVSLSSLNKGIYILKLQNKTGSTTKKLIKE